MLIGARCNLIQFDIVSVESTSHEKAKKVTHDQSEQSQRRKRDRDRQLLPNNLRKASERNKHHKIGSKVPHDLLHDAESVLQRAREEKGKEEKEKEKDPRSS